MGGWLALIPWRVKLAVAAVAVFALALFGWHRTLVGRAVSAALQKVEKEKVDAILKRERIDNEVNALDDDDLRRAASDWVRGTRR